MANGKKKSTPKKRRRVSGVGSKLDLQGVGLAVAGAVAASLLSKQLAKSTNTTMQKYGAYLPLVAGIVLPMFVKNPMIKQLSLGLAASGGVLALTKANVLKGVGLMSSTINGYAPLPFRQTGRQQGVVNGANWSGSQLPQTRVISGIVPSPSMNGSGAGAPFQ